MKLTYSPIAVFAFNRPRHFARTLLSLIDNFEFNKSKIFIFLDGPKRTIDYENQEKILRYMKSLNLSNIKLVHRSVNLGLSKNIITGVNEVLSEHDSIIVVEDDLVLSPFFLKYMNEGLKIFKDTNDVASVHGYIYPKTKFQNDIFFIKGADCWGWGTWKRAWDLLELNGEFLFSELKKRKLLNEFNFGHSGPFIRMLKNQIKGKNDSWAVRWYASMFLQNKYTLYPRVSLVQNIGLDGSGTHSSRSSAMNVPLADAPINVRDMDVVEYPEDRAQFASFFRKQKYSNIQNIFSILK